MNAQATTATRFYTEVILDGEVVSTIDANSAEAAHADFDEAILDDDGYDYRLVIDGEVVFTTICEDETPAHSDEPSLDPILWESRSNDYDEFDALDAAGF